MPWQADRSAMPPLWWRLAHSIWVLPAIVGAGVLTWLGFVYIGVRARNRRWLIAGGLWLVYSAVAIAITAPYTAKGQVVPSAQSLVFLMGYLAGLIHTFVTLPGWWRWCAERSRAKWTARAEARAWQIPDLPPAAGGIPNENPSPEGLRDTHDAHPAVATHHPSFPPESHLTQAAAQEVSDSSLPTGFIITGLGVIEGQPEGAAGSFGTVYRIRRDFDGKPVAGKVFRVPRGAFGQAQAERSLRDEVAVLESLHHPNIVRMLNPVPLGDSGSWMAISEWIEGSTLEAAAYGIDPMSLEQVHAVGSQLLSALVYLERCGVVHRDIKPANIMVDQSGTVKLIDFNLTRTVGHQTALAGTTPYLPPDYLIGDQVVDPLVDRFGVAVVLYELVVGKHPYHEYELSGLPILPTSVPVDARSLRPEISDGLAGFLNRAVQGRQSDRFPSATAMQQAWEAAMGTGVTNTAAPNRER